MRLVLAKNYRSVTDLIRICGAIHVTASLIIQPVVLFLFKYSRGDVGCNFLASLLYFIQVFYLVLVLLWWWGL